MHSRDEPSDEQCNKTARVWYRLDGRFCWVVSSRWPRAAASVRNLPVGRGGTEARDTQHLRMDATQIPVNEFLVPDALFYNSELYLIPVSGWSQLCNWKHKSFQMESWIWNGEVWAHRWLVAMCRCNCWLVAMCRKCCGEKPILGLASSSGCVTFITMEQSVSCDNAQLQLRTKYHLIHV